MDETQAIRWQGDCLALLDQRLLPAQVSYLELFSAAEVARAISDLVVRGAPAIGITAAWAVVLSAREHAGNAGWRERMAADMDQLSQARPTAVNLNWALGKMATVVKAAEQDTVEDLALAAALEIHQHDQLANRAIGEYGAGLIKPGSQVMTHCNAGALATGGYGTALGVIRSDAILYRANFTHTSPSLPLDEWMLSNALAFRMALEKGYRNLAEQIVSTLL